VYKEKVKENWSHQPFCVFVFMFQRTEKKMVFGVMFET
jgi:hypothetical protein